MNIDLSMLAAQIVSGLCRGMILFLMASGLTLVFGVMRVINFAHGSFFALAAYMAYSVTQLFIWADYSFWVALLIVPATVAGVGGIVEYILLRRIYEQEHLLQILLTYALIFIFNDSIKFLWGTEMRIVKMPPLLSGSAHIFGLVFPAYYLFIIGTGLAVAVGMWFILKTTTIGKLIRAAAERRDMVGLLGYNVGFLFTVVFMFAAGLAGLAGVVIAPTTRLALGMDIAIIIECFLVIIIGGLGNVWGALLAALITGQTYALGILVLEKYAMTFLFVLAALIIICRPAGLLGKLVRQEGEN